MDKKQYLDYAGLVELVKQIDDNFVNTENALTNDDILEIIGEFVPDIPAEDSSSATATDIDNLFSNGEGGE